MAPFRIATLAAVAALLGGCQTAFDLVGVSVPLPISDTRHWAGSYQGQIRQVAANGPGCPTESGQQVIMVGDDVVWYAYSPVIFFASPIRYDGTIESTSGSATMRGKIVGDHMDVLIKSPVCETRMSLHYIYNRS